MISDDRITKFLEELSESGIIAVAAKRVSISRSTIYEWRDADNDFAEKLEKSLNKGRDNWCDFSENQIHSLIKEKQLGAIKFFLESNNRRYYRPRKAAPFVQEHAPIHLNVMLTKKNPIEVTTEPPDEPRNLTEILKRALKNGRIKDLESEMENCPPTRAQEIMAEMEALKLFRQKYGNIPLGEWMNRQQDKNLDELPPQLPPTLGSDNHQPLE